MIAISLFLLAASTLGLIVTVYFTNKRRDVQDKLLMSHFEGMKDAFDEIWVEIDVLRVMINDIEKEEIHDPEVSHE